MLGRLALLAIVAAWMTPAGAQPRQGVPQVPIAPDSETAFFTFSQARGSGQKYLFVFKLVGFPRIAEARGMLEGRTKRKHVQGLIVKDAAAYNPLWTFHMEPRSIVFFENQAEVCDANVQFVQDNLAKVGKDFLPNALWCPWSSVLEAEVTHLIQR